jgi:chromosomal replication initiator protein
MMDIWQAALCDLETRVSSHNFESWFKNILFHHQDAQTAYLEVRDEFSKAWIEENYLDLIEDALRQVSGVAYRAVLGVRGSFGASRVTRSLDLRDEAPAAREARLGASQAQLFHNDEPALPVAEPAPVSAPRPETLRPLLPPQHSEPAPAPQPPASVQEAIQAAGINPRYTFDEFVVGPSNQFTHAACASIADNPGKNYNPLFIFGGVGLGKTHLLQAVGIEILKQHPTWRVVNMSSEEFMNQLITSLRQRDMNSFRAHFRDECDVLLIDDIQFIGSKDSTQEEFFHTFNALYHSGKQIVITSDKPPKDLPGIEERLRSRFSWGLIADIQPPEVETRIAILKKKAEADGIALSNEVALLLASSIRSNVRELEGTLVRLGAQASLMSMPITLDMAREHLKRINVESTRQINVDKIIRVVAERFEITSNDIRGDRRTRAISEPRQIAMYLTRHHTDHSLPEIGRKFGGKDHTTVLAACRKIEKTLPTDEALANLIRSLELELDR